MTTVFYPGMGVDIVTPVLCVGDVERIIATGPYEGMFEGRNVLQQVFNCICDLVNSGAIQNEETGEWIEFWTPPMFDEDIVQAVVKKYYFKSKDMWLMQFKYNNRIITLNYYVSLNPNDKNYKHPINEKVDYIIHKTYRWKINPNTFTNVILPICKVDTPSITKLIGTKEDLRGIWNMPKDAFNQEIKEYAHVVEQTAFTDNEEKPLYAIEITNSSFATSKTK